jgi:hypothetical protein
MDRVCRTGQGVRPRDLPGLSLSQVYEALVRRDGFGLVVRGHGWTSRTDRTLTEVAVDHAVAELREQRVERYRADHHEAVPRLAALHGPLAAFGAARRRAPPDGAVSGWRRAKRRNPDSSSGCA